MINRRFSCGLWALSWACKDTFDGELAHDGSALLSFHPRETEVTIPWCGDRFPMEQLLEADLDGHNPLCVGMDGILMIPAWPILVPHAAPPLEDVVQIEHPDGSTHQVLDR